MGVTVAFVVSDQCRASPILMNDNSIASTTGSFIQSYGRHVLAPHLADGDYVAFVLLTGTDCGTGHCSSLMRGANATLARRSKTCSRTMNALSRDVS